MNTKFYELEINRHFNCSVEKIFRAWADLEIKRKWFRGPASWVETGRELDLREGGRETMYGHFDGTMETVYTAHYYDVQPNARIGYTFEVRLDGVLFSISTAVVEFTATETGVQMDFHEQLACYHDREIELQRIDRLRGTNEHFDRLREWVEA